MLYLHIIFGKKLMPQLVKVGGVLHFFTLSLPPVGFLPVSQPCTSSLLNLLSSADYALSSNSPGPPPRPHLPVFAASFYTTFCLRASFRANLLWPFHLVGNFDNAFAMKQFIHTCTVSWMPRSIGLSASSDCGWAGRLHKG